MGNVLSTARILAVLERGVWWQKAVHAAIRTAKRALAVATGTEVWPDAGAGAPVGAAAGRVSRTLPRVAPAHRSRGRRPGVGPSCALPRPGRVRRSHRCGAALLSEPLPLSGAERVPPRVPRRRHAAVGARLRLQSTIRPMKRPTRRPPSPRSATSHSTSCSAVSAGCSASWPASAPASTQWRANGSSSKPGSGGRRITPRGGAGRSGSTC